MAKYIIAITLLLSGTASAQNGEALMLTRLAISESDWASPPDHQAIHQVIQRRAEVLDTSYVEAAQAYSKFATGAFDCFEDLKPSLGEFLETARKKCERQRWVQSIQLTCEEPRGWPVDEYGVWARYKQRCRNVVRRSRILVAGGWLVRKCERSPHHWGGDMDEPSPRLRRVNCHGTLNTFYVVRPKAIPAELAMGKM